MKVGEEAVKIKQTICVKQSDNLDPIYFIILIKAVSTMLDKKRNFATPNFRRLR